MFGPIILIARDPLVFLLLILAVLGSMIVKNSLQAGLAALLGDRSAREAGFTSLEPAVHFSLASLASYLLLGLALPRPIPLRPLSGRLLPGQRGRALLAPLCGPLLLALLALGLLLLQRMQQQYFSGLDPLGLALGRSGYTLTQHAVFFLLPLPALDLGRALLLGGPRQVRRVLAVLQAAGPLATVILWLLLALSGVLSWASAPLWRLLGALVGLLP